MTTDTTEDSVDVTDVGLTELKATDAALTVKQAKAMLNLGLRTIYDMLDSGRLQGFRAGTRKGRRVLLSSVVKLMAERDAPKAPEPRPTVSVVPKLPPQGRRRLLRYEDVMASRPT